MAKKRKKSPKKPSPKPTTKAAKAAASKAASKPGAKPRIAKAVSKPAKPQPPKAVKAPTASKKPAASGTARSQPAPSARPASKPHVHPAGEAVEAPRRRARAGSAGPAPTPPTSPTHNGIGDEAVRSATGKGWAEWLEILDQAGARALEHKAIVAILREKHGVGDWWCQMVTVGYEQARGLREKHQTASGFQASMSKTIAAPVSRLYKAWAEESEREKWLGDVPVEVRVANEDKNIRLTWLKEGPEQGTSVEVGFFAKDGVRGMVQVQQNKLENAEAVARVKAFWSVKLETLRSVLEK